MSSPRVMFCLVPLVLLAAASLGPSLTAAEIHVPGDHPTIQGAIDAAADGDVILIAAGTYLENLRLFGKAITLRGAGIDLTTIDGSSAPQGSAIGSTIICLEFEGRDTVIEDLTVTGGTGTTVAGTPFLENGEVGGGLYARMATPTLRRVRFRGNQADRGAGVYITTPPVPYSITDCEFVENSGAGQVAIYVNGPSSLVFEDCIVARNISDVEASGALFVADDLAVRRCRFEENLSSESFGIGAALSTFTPGGQFSEQVLVEDCVFYANRATGGASIISILSTLAVRRCLFVQNFATGFGGGIVADRVELTVEHCVFAGNQSASGSSVTSSTGVGTTIDIDHCTFHGDLEGVSIQPYNSPLTVTNSIGWEFESQEFVSSDFTPGEIRYSTVAGGAPGVGNLSLDPQFINPAAFDFSLAPTSPCIDAGDPTFPLDPDGSVTDMGANPALLPSFVVTVFRRGDANLDGMIDVADPLTILADFFFGGSPIACVSAADGNDDGLFDLADPIYLLNYLFQEGPEPPAPLDCGVDPTPDTSCDAPDTGC